MIFCCYPVGRILGLPGYLPSSIAGLIFVSAPIAIIANFNALLSSILIESLPIILVLNFVIWHIVSWHERSRGQFTTEGNVIFLGLGLALSLLIIFWVYQFNSAEYYLFDSHEYYFASIPLELNIADYESRLRMFFAYPFEWAKYYFLQGTSLALIISQVDDPNFFTVKIAKFVIAILTFLAVSEMFWRYPDIIKNKYQNEAHIIRNERILTFSSMFILFFMFSTVYFFAFTWGFKSNNFLAFSCAMLFSIARIRSKIAESHVWLLLLAICQLKALPACMMSLMIIMLSDAGFGVKSPLREPKLILSRGHRLFLENKKIGSIFLGLLFLCIIYAITALMAPSSSYVDTFKIQLSFPFDWWILVPEANLLVKVWEDFFGLFVNKILQFLFYPSALDFTALNLVYSFFALLNEKVGDLVFPLSFIASSLLAIRYFDEKKHKVAFLSITCSLMISGLIFPPYTHAPVVSIFSFIWLVPVVLMIVALEKTKLKIGVGLVFCIVLYVYPLNLFFGNILNVGSTQLTSIVDAKSPVGAISRHDNQVRSNINRPRNYIYCAEGDPLFNEAVGGHTGRRVALTKDNLMNFEHLRNSLLLLRHVPGFEEEILRDPEEFELLVEQYSCSSKNK